MIYLVIILVLVIIIVFLLIKPKKKKKVDPSLQKQDLTKSEVIKLKEITQSDLPDKLEEALKGRFKDCVPISAGGMGVIVHAFDIENNRKVAIKTVLPELKENEKAVKLFFGECNAIKTMNHPNIVKIFEVGESDILYYYIMEFLEGDDIKALMSKEKQLPLSRVVKIGTQVTRGLQHCHDNQIIHRDIKPSNIMVMKNDQAKIVDFGIVKLISGDPSIIKGTTKIGSPDFASPEQIQGQQISGKSDIYSLGICLYYMLSGKMPFKGSNMVAKMFEKPRDIKQFCPDLSDECANLLYSCLDLDPAKRPQAHELWAKLRALK